MENLIPIQKDMELPMKIWIFGKAFNEGQQLTEDMMIKYQKRENDNE